jgi:hypothetical protein
MRLSYISLCPRFPRGRAALPCVQRQAFRGFGKERRAIPALVSVLLSQAAMKCVHATPAMIEMPAARRPLAPEPA